VRNVGKIGALSLPVDKSRGPLVAAAVIALPHFPAMILAAFGKVGTRQHVRRLTFPARTPELVSVFAAVVGVFWRDIRHARPFDVGPARSVFLESDRPSREDLTLFGDFE
jgi:hypothetical protein